MPPRCAMPSRQPSRIPPPQASAESGGRTELRNPNPRAWILFDALGKRPDLHLLESHADVARALGNTSLHEEFVRCADAVGMRGANVVLQFDRVVEILPAN